MLHKYVSKDKTDDLTGNVFGASRLYVDASELKFAVQNQATDVRLAKMFHADPKIVPFELSLTYTKKIVSYSMYVNKGSLIPYPFRAIYCRYVEGLLQTTRNLPSLKYIFTEEEGDYDISHFNDYASTEQDLRFIFCLWREVRHFREKSYGYTQTFVS